MVIFIAVQTRIVNALTVATRETNRVQDPAEVK
jgi:hypothetical protein